MQKNLANRVKGFLGKMEFAFSGLRYGQRELLVLNLHSTPHNRISDLERFLSLLREHFKPLHPDKLGEYFRDSSPLTNGPYVLLTFDDGLLNNFEAAEILAKFGFSGLFFVVPQFIDSTEPAQYYRQFIRPDIDPKVDSKPEDFTPMSWEQLRKLLHDNHRIGSHSLSHRIWRTMSVEECEKELIESKQTIKARTDYETPFFCSPNDTLLSVNEISKGVIKANYSFHFTTFPGLNASYRDPQMILRRNIEVHWPRPVQLFALGKWDLKRWEPKIRQYQNLQSSIHQPR